MDPAPTLNNNSHSGRRLIDKPDIFSESLNSSEQNQHRYILFFYLKFFWVRSLLLLKFLWIFWSDFSAASSRCKRLILLQVAATYCKKSCKWLILLQVAAASCKKSCKWLILLLVAAAGGCCKWPAATGSCRFPNIGGSVQTRSLQVDLLQVPIHRLTHWFPRG